MLKTSDDPEPTVLAMVGELALWAPTLVVTLCEQADRVVIFPDALDALERVPALRPSVLLLPSHPVHVSAPQVARNLTTRMSRSCPYLVLVGDRAQWTQRELAAFDELHDIRRPLTRAALAQLFVRAAAARHHRSALREAG